MFDLSWLTQAYKREYTKSDEKVITLAEAIRQHIEPGQIIQIGGGVGYPMALIYELIRQFYEGNPGFTYVSSGGSCTNLVPMLSGKMVKKVIATFLGDPYPYPSPNPVVQKAFARGEIEVEEWSMLTLVLRLVAGAMNLPFFPTKSLLGSSMAENNPNFHYYEDPFTGEEVGLVRALNPDICLFHGWMSDPYGNTVVNMPLAGNVYGALASRKGVIVSTEKIVSTEEMQKYREHIRIPGSIVKAVVKAPYGAHPSGHHHFPHRDEEGGYAEDKNFIIDTRRVCKDKKELQEWIDYWILDCANHDEYLHKLGYERLLQLKGAVYSSTWNIQMLAEEEKEQPPSSTPAEKMIITASRYIENIVRAKEYDSILTGVGASHLASWIAYYQMSEKGFHVPLMAEIGLYGYLPLPGDPFVFALRNMPTAEMYSEIFHILGIMVQGNPSRCLGILGAGQIDRFGNINSSQVPAMSLYLVGSGGGNDVASGAEEVLVVLEQDNLRFLEELPYITSPGKKVNTVISPLGVYRKDKDDGELKLVAYMSDVDESEEKAVEKIKERCSWQLKVSPELEIISPPTEEELQRLRMFDPDRFFLGS